MDLLKNTPSRVIAFEGVDGCGKTSMLNFVQNRLDEEGVSNIILEMNPKTSEYGLILNDDRYTPKQRLCYLGLVAIETANRIEEARKTGKWVLLDRSPLSREVYQSMTDGLTTETRSLEAIIGPFPHIDYMVFMDIEYDDAYSRAMKHTYSPEAEIAERDRSLLIYDNYYRAIGEYAHLQEHFKKSKSPWTEIIRMDAMQPLEDNAAMLLYGINDSLTEESLK